MADTPEDGQGGMQTPERILEQLGKADVETSIMPAGIRATYFFTYDLLMDHTIISRHTKGLIEFKVVKVVNHRIGWPLFFPPLNTALPSLVRTNNPQDVVWGLLYTATRVDFSLLDRHLKTPDRYHSKAIRVEDRGGRGYHASAYVLSSRSEVDLKPSAAYLENLVSVCKDHSLPEDWIARLEALETA